MIADEENDSRMVVMAMRGKDNAQQKRSFMINENYGQYQTRVFIDSLPIR